jgi:hypothetical protein
MCLFAAAVNTRNMFNEFKDNIDPVTFWEQINTYEDNLKMYAKKIKETNMIEKFGRTFPNHKDTLALYIQLLG